MNFEHQLKQVISSRFIGDKRVVSDSDYVQPDALYEHIQSLLGQKISPSSDDKTMTDFIEQNIDNFPTELDHQFTKADFLKVSSVLKNNKAALFDKITNEILKAGRHQRVLKLFNKIFESSIYPTLWKLDILTPLHKSGEKIYNDKKVLNKLVPSKNQQFRPNLPALGR